ncbi:MAG: nucleotide-binding universal stress UspA family protein [Nonlabens sp.]|jgi:nucleotide-binding universal stress UspA family protein
MKTILVPTDFSEQANNALDLAVQIARKSNANILVVNVIEGLRDFSFNTMGEVENDMGEEVFIIKKLIDQVKIRLSQIVKDERYSDVKIESAVEMGNAFESISKVIADRHADLLVMGTKGTSGLVEVLIGSNTEKVVRYAKCPVITVKEKVSLDSIKNIVFASNLQDEQTALVKKLKVIQEITDATLHLVKVNTPNHFSTQRQMMKEFARFIEKHDISNASTSIYNEATEEDGVLYFAEDLGACMIAMGTHGRTGILHLLSGSIAEDLVNHARVPVWTLSQKASR